jgi:hypothetical protein
MAIAPMVRGEQNKTEHGKATAREQEASDILIGFLNAHFEARIKAERESFDVDGLMHKYILDHACSHSDRWAVSKAWFLAEEAQLHSRISNAKLDFIQWASTHFPSVEVLKSLREILIREISP